MESWNNVHMHAWRARKPEACGLWKGRDTSVWKALDGTEPSGEPKTPRGPPEAPNTKARAYTNFTGTQSAEKRTVSLPFSRSSVTIQSVSLPFRDDFDPYIHEHSDDDYMYLKSIPLDAHAPPHHLILRARARCPTIDSESWLPRCSVGSQSDETRWPPCCSACISF